MKKIRTILNLLMILPLAVSAQKKTTGKVKISPANTPKESSFTITVNTKAVPSDKVYLVYRLTKPDGGSTEVKDSLQSVDGIVEFKGSLPTPIYGETFNEDKSFYTMFWLENGKIYINANTENGAEVVGSQTNDDHMLFQKTTRIHEIRKLVVDKKNEIEAARNQGNDSLSKKLSDEKDQLIEHWEGVADQFVVDHPKSYFSLNQVYNRAGLDKYPYDKLKFLYDKLDDNLKHTHLASVIENYLAAAKLLLIGEKFPEYAQPDLNGHMVNIADYKGKYLLLTFSQSKESKYRSENKSKVTLYGRYKEKGFEIADVVFDNKKELVESMIKEDNIQWTVLCDFKGWFKNEAMKKYKIEKIPVNFLIDQKGTIIARDLWGTQLENKIAELLK